MPECFSGSLILWGELSQKIPGSHYRYGGRAIIVDVAGYDGAHSIVMRGVIMEGVFKIREW